MSSNIFSSADNTTKMGKASDSEYTPDSDHEI